MKIIFGRSRSGYLVSVYAASALALLLGASVSACGSSTKSSAAGDQVASSTPIPIEFPNLQGSTQGINIPESSAAAEAAVEWINHHGGVQGRPFKLTVCQLLTTPASDVACANSMAAAHPVAVAAGGVDNPVPMVTALAAAGIPWVVQGADSQIELTSHNTFAFSPGNTGGYNAVAAHEQQHGGHNVSLVLNGTAGVVDALQSQATPTFARHGVTVRAVVTNPTGQADLAPVIQAAVKPPVSGVFMDEDPTTCIAGFAAKGTLQVASSIRFYASPTCESQAEVRAFGANANGAFFAQEGDISNQKDPDWAVYNSAMNQYAPGVTHYSFAPAGFQTVMNLYRVMLTMGKTPITSASVLAALHNARNIKGFLANGSTFSCNGTVFKASPSVCGGTSFLETWTQASGFKYVGEYMIPPGS